MGFVSNNYVGVFLLIGVLTGSALFINSSLSSMNHKSYDNSSYGFNDINALGAKMSDDQETFKGQLTKFNNDPSWVEKAKDLFGLALSGAALMFTTIFASVNTITGISGAILTYGAKNNPVLASAIDVLRTVVTAIILSLVIFAVAKTVFKWEL